MLAFIQARLDAGALSVTQDQVFAAVVPPNHPEFRLRPAYRYGLSRLQVRRVINAVDDHLLKDIGLSRADVQRESSKSFWKT